MIMKRYLQVLIVFTFLLGISCWDYEQGVLVLTDQNIEEALQTFPQIFLNIYGLSCSHCIQFQPEYERLAYLVSKKMPNMKIAKIEGQNRISMMRQLCGEEYYYQKRYHVQAYPTFKYIMNGYPIDYEGMRYADAILEYLEKMNGESIDSLNSLEEVQEYLADSPLALIYFIQNPKEANMKAFKIASKIFEEIGFGYTLNPEARKFYNVKKNSIILFRDFDEKVEHRGKIGDQTLITFLDENAYPSFGEFNVYAETRIFKRQKSALFLFWNENEESYKWKDEIEKMAPYLKKRAQVVTLNPKDGFMTSAMDRLELKEIAQFPDLYYYKTTPGNRAITYRFNDVFDEDNVLKFLEYSEFGKLGKKNQGPPPMQIGSMLQLASSNFEDQVYRSGKDVLVYFTNSENRQAIQISKTANEILGKLAEKLQNQNVKIGTLDIATNQIKNLELNKIPLVRFYRAKSPNSPVDYNELVTEQGIIAFIKLHSSFELVNFKINSDL